MQGRYLDDAITFRDSLPPTPFLDAQTEEQTETPEVFPTFVSERLLFQSGCSTMGEEQCSGDIPDITDLLPSAQCLGLSSFPAIQEWIAADLRKLRRHFKATISAAPQHQGFRWNPSADCVGAVLDAIPEVESVINEDSHCQAAYELAL